MKSCDVEKMTGTVTLLSKHTAVVADDSGIGLKAIGSDSVVLFYPFEGRLACYIGDMEGEGSESLSDMRHADAAGELFQTLTENMWEDGLIVSVTDEDEPDGAVSFGNPFAGADDFRDFTASLFSKLN